MVARKIHKISQRKNGPFTVLNGALLDVKKYELELFGEEKDNGSITYGSLEKSSGGILLIDEVTEIPLETQSKILRVLADQKFKRINGNHDIKVDVRIICSTSKNIHEEIKYGNFRWKYRKPKCYASNESRIIPFLPLLKSNLKIKYASKKS